MLARIWSSGNPHLLVECGRDCYFGTVLQFLTKLNILLSYNLTATFFGIYPNDGKSYQATKWQRRALCIVAKRSEYEKATYCMIPTMRHFWKGKNYRDRKENRVARVGEKGWQEEHRGFFRAENLLFLVNLKFTLTSECIQSLDISQILKCTGQRLNPNELQTSVDKISLPVLTNVAHQGKVLKVEETGG